MRLFVARMADEQLSLMNQHLRPCLPTILEAPRMNSGTPRK
jgi:hypothetical protein